MSSKWQVASGKWQVASGKWQVASGKWQVAAAGNSSYRPATDDLPFTCLGRGEVQELLTYFPTYDLPLACLPVGRRDLGT